jgi:alpha-L-arabinofuranosidase
MTGMERNSDVVLMASYAPLLVNVNNRAWNPDLIGYDSSRVYGTPSYYVQKLFSANRGDVVLASELKLAGQPPAEPVRGGIGLGTWSTRAEYKDIQVTRGDKVVFQSDFSRGLKGWNPAHGHWVAQNGALLQSGGDTDCRCLAGDPSWGDYTYSLKARKLGGAEGFLVMFHAKDRDNWVWWNLGGWGNVRHALEICRNGDKSLPDGGVPGRIETGRWYDLRIELQGEKIRCYLDGKLIQEAVQTPTAVSPVYAVASRASASGEVLLKLVNASASRVATHIDLEGIGKLQPTATALVLSGDPADENSVDEPAKVVPVTETVEHVSPRFLYTLPAQSAVILRLKPANGLGPAEN